MLLLFSGMALSHFANGSTETVDLRMPLHSSDPRRSISTSEGSTGSGYRYPSTTSEHSTSSFSSSTNSPVRTMSGLGSPKAVRRAHASGGVQIAIPNKVPPPTGFLVQASRDKDGFFVNQKRKDYKMFLEKNSETSSPDEDERYSRKEFVPKEGNLQRNHGIKGHAMKSQHPKIITRNRDLTEANASSPKEERGQRLAPSSNQGTAFFHSNLKRSFRYRKIVLRKEFESPLFPTKENSDSEDEGDTLYENEPSSAVPGPADSLSLSTNLTRMPDEVEISNTDLTSPGPHINSVVQRRYNYAAASQNTSSMSFAGYSPGNSYSKVTVTGPKRSSSSSIPGKRPVVYLRSNSVHVQKQTSIEDVVTPENSFVILPPPMFAEEEKRVSGVDMIDLPARPPSDNMMYGSRSSLDLIQVDPPDMFSAEPANKPTSPKSKRKLSRTRKALGSASSVSAKEERRGDSEADEYSKQGGDLAQTDKKLKSGSGNGDKLRGGSTSKQLSNQPVSVSNVVPDRDSTESSDTGYTSSTSPGYSEGGQRHTKLNYQETPTNEERNMPKPNSLHNMRGQSNLKSIPSLNSLVSISSDTSRFYIPLVFHSPRVEGAGVSHDPNSFSVQVCLVENSDELIKVSASLNWTSQKFILSLDNQL